MKRKTQIAKTATHSVFVPLLLPTSKGLRAIVILDSQERSAVGKYWNAVHHYLKKGDASKLKKFRGKYVTPMLGSKFMLLTDLAELDRLGHAGILSFDSIYRK